MADVIEFTTWPKHQNIFYKITSGALVFYVKGERNAAVGLAKKPGQECDYWIGIGENQYSWIKKDGRTGKKVSTPNILSRDVYKRFWISWNNKQLRLGQGDDAKPIVTEKNTIQDLYYVTFSVLGERNSVHWKCHIPPQIETAVVKKISGGEPQWMPADDQLPDGAMIGGHEKESLYIIRASHRGSLTPGKFVASLGLGFISWGGDMHETNEFEVLCGYNCIWVKTHGNRIPVGAVEGGYSEDGHEILYVGRAICDDHLIPGKVQPSHEVCYIPYNEKEIAKKDYEILVVPHNTTQCASSYYITNLEVISLSSEHQTSDSEQDDYEIDSDQ